MDEFCNCDEWDNLVDSYDLIKHDPAYGWMFSWVELTKEEGYTQVHRYGFGIKFCPMCGKKCRLN